MAREDIGITKGLDPDKMFKIAASIKNTNKEQGEGTKKIKEQNKEMKTWEQNMARMQELVEKYAKHLKITAVPNIGETTKNISKQGTILTRVRKHWTELTGAIIGSFYTIAKLSPLFASYISEFGGVLGYVYDTAIIPWSDEIEWLLDKLWALGDWFDNAPKPLQKFAGALMIGIPLLTGLGVAAVTAITIFGHLMSLPVVAQIGGWAATFISASTAVLLIKVALIAVIAYLILTNDTVQEKLSSIKNNFFKTAENIKTIIDNLKRGTIGRFKEMLGEERWERWKTTVTNVIGAIKKAFSELFEMIIEKATPIGWLSDVLETTAGASGKLAEWSSGYAEGYATGGTITQDGLYRLHRGEIVVPATQVSNSEKNSTNIVIAPVINMGGSMTNSHQARLAADEMSQYWLRDIRKVLGGSHRA